MVIAIERDTQGRLPLHRTASISAGMIAPDAPILVFDSGIGGLSVLAKIQMVLPTAPIIYSADYAGLPYGEKSEIEVATRVCAFLGRLSERYAPRLVVIACNTASTIALAHARAVLGVPIVGTVPAIKPAAEQTQSGVIGLLGTKATIRQAYVDRLESEHAKGKTLLRHAAPELVAAAEAKLRGEAPDPVIFTNAIGGLTDQTGGDQIDQIILGCTHFPLVEQELAAAAAEAGLREDLAFVDGSDGIARRVANLTEGQPWPAKPSVGKFISTGPVEQIEPYRPALLRYNLTQIMSL
jgi:glutamate racemase